MVRPRRHGPDIIGFLDQKFDGPWDIYQCKRYALKLAPAHIWVELGKIISYYTHLEAFTVPQNYYFAASKGVGLSLQKLLSDPVELKAADRNCDRELQGQDHGYGGHRARRRSSRLPEQVHIPASSNTVAAGLSWLQGTQEPILTSALRSANFPTVLRSTSASGHSCRREPVCSAVVRGLFGKVIEATRQPDQLSAHPELQAHFDRSREVFYHAESLRNFPRDSVDPGAFDAIRDEIYHGCVILMRWTMRTASPASDQLSTMRALLTAELQCALHPRTDAG